MNKNTKTNKKDAANEALLKSTVERINAILEETKTQLYPFIGTLENGSLIPQIRLVVVPEKKETK